MANYNQPPSFKTDVHRAPTKKWVDAKSYSYEGDDWGDDDEYDEYGTNEEPPVPLKPTGLRQKGQNLTSSASTSRDEPLPPVPSMPAVSAANAPVVPSSRNRSNSFEAGDERDNFAAAAPRPTESFNFSSTAEPLQSRAPLSNQQGFRQQLPSTPAQSSESQYAPIQTKLGTWAPRLSVMDATGGRVSVSSASSVTGLSVSSDQYPQRRDFSQPYAVPEPLHTRAPSVPSTENDAPSTVPFPPRKSSLSQSRPPDLSGLSQGTQPSVLAEQLEPTSAAATIPATQTPPPRGLFIRPADIYRRMEEEKEKERQSLEGRPPSVDSLDRAARSNVSVGHTAGARQASASPSRFAPGHSVMSNSAEVEQSSPIRPSLHTVPERKSEYGITGFAVSNPILARAIGAGIAQTPPSLPQLNRMSDFSSSIWDSTGVGNRETGPQQFAVADPSKTATDEAEPASQHDGNERTIQSKPSAGFRSAVTHAFERQDDESAPATPLSAQHRGTFATDTELSRSNTDSTAGISPILGRGHGNTLADGMAIGEDDQGTAATLSLTEDHTRDLRLTSSRPASSSTMHDQVSGAGLVHSRNVSTGSNPTSYRHELHTPSRGSSPARSPAIEAEPHLPAASVAQLENVRPTSQQQAVDSPSAVELPDMQTSPYTVRETDLATAVNTHSEEQVTGAADAQEQAQTAFIESRPESDAASNRIVEDSASGDKSPTRAASPNKGRVKVLAEKYDDLSLSRELTARSPTESMSSWASGSARSTSPQRPPDSIDVTGQHRELMSGLDGNAEFENQLRLETNLAVETPYLRPRLPGEWVSYADSSRDSEVQEDMEDSSSRAATPKGFYHKSEADTPQAEDAEVDFSPTTARRHLSGQTFDESINPVENPMAALAAAGSAMAASLMSAVGMARTDSESESDVSESVMPSEDDRTPGLMDHNYDDLPAVSDHVEHETTNADSEISSTLPLRDEQDQEVGEIVAHHRVPSYSHEAEEPGIQQVEEQRPVEPTATPAPLEGDNETVHTSEDLEDDRLGREFNGSSSLAFSGPRAVPHVRPYAVQNVSEGPDSSSFSRESTVLPREYDSYWAEKDNYAYGSQNTVDNDGVSDVPLADRAEKLHQQSLESEPSALTVPATTKHEDEVHTRSLEPETSAAYEPVNDLRIDTVTHPAPQPVLMDSRFSWEENEELKPFRQRFDKVSSLPEPATAEPSNFEDQVPGRTSGPPRYSGSSHGGNATSPILPGPFRHSTDVPDVPTSPYRRSAEVDKVRTLSTGREHQTEGSRGFASAAAPQDSEDLAQRADPLDERPQVPSKDESPPEAVRRDHEEVQEDQQLVDLHTSRGIGPAAALGVKRPSRQSRDVSSASLSGFDQPSQPRLTGFKDISSMKDTRERIERYQKTQEEFATLRTGLNDWLNFMLTSHPELAYIEPGQSRPSGTMGGIAGSVRHKLSPSVAKFSRSKTGSSPTQAPYYQQHLDSAAMVPGQGLAEMSSAVPSDGLRGRRPSMTMQTKGKDLFHSAGVLGGKATLGAKGLFARGKSKLIKGGPSEKTQPSPQATLGQRMRSPFRRSRPTSFVADNHQPNLPDTSEPIPRQIEEPTSDVVLTSPTDSPIPAGFGAAQIAPAVAILPNEESSSTEVLSARGESQSASTVAADKRKSGGSLGSPGSNEAENKALRAVTTEIPPNAVDTKQDASTSQPGPELVRKDSGQISTVQNELFGNDLTTHDSHTPQDNTDYSFQTDQLEGDHKQRAPTNRLDPNEQPATTGMTRYRPVGYDPEGMRDSLADTYSTDEATPASEVGVFGARGLVLWDDTSPDTFHHDLPPSLLGRTQPEAKETGKYENAEEGKLLAARGNGLHGVAQSQNMVTGLIPGNSSEGTATPREQSQPFVPIHESEVSQVESRSEDEEIDPVSPISRPMSADMLEWKALPARPVSEIGSLSSRPASGQYQLAPMHQQRPRFGSALRQPSNDSSLRPEDSASQRPRNSVQDTIVSQQPRDSPKLAPPVISENEAPLARPEEVHPDDSISERTMIRTGDLDGPSPPENIGELPTSVQKRYSQFSTPTTPTGLAQSPDEELPPMPDNGTVGVRNPRLNTTEYELPGVGPPSPVTPSPKKRRMSPFGRKRSRSSGFNYDQVSDVVPPMPERDSNDARTPVNQDVKVSNQTKTKSVVQQPSSASRRRRMSSPFDWLRSRSRPRSPVEEFIPLFPDSEGEDTTPSVDQEVATAAGNQESEFQQVRSVSRRRRMSSPFRWRRTRSRPQSYVSPTAPPLPASGGEGTRNPNDQDLGSPISPETRGRKVQESSFASTKRRLSSTFGRIRGRSQSRGYLDADVVEALPLRIDRGDSRFPNYDEVGATTPTLAGAGARQSLVEAEIHPRDDKATAQPAAFDTDAARPEQLDETKRQEIPISQTRIRQSLPREANADSTSRVPEAERRGRSWLGGLKGCYDADEGESSEVRPRTLTKSDKKSSRPASQILIQEDKKQQDSVRPVPDPATEIALTPVRTLASDGAAKRKSFGRQPQSEVATDGASNREGHVKYLQAQDIFPSRPISRKPPPSYRAELAVAASAQPFAEIGQREGIVASSAAQTRQNRPQKRRASPHQALLQQVQPISQLQPLQLHPLQQQPLQQQPLQQQPLQQQPPQPSLQQPSLKKQPLQQQPLQQQPPQQQVHPTQQSHQQERRLTTERASSISHPTSNKSSSSPQTQKPYLSLQEYKQWRQASGSGPQSPILSGPYAPPAVYPAPLVPTGTRYTLPPTINQSLQQQPRLRVLSAESPILLGPYSPSNKERPQSLSKPMEQDDQRQGLPPMSPPARSPFRPSSLIASVPPSPTPALALTHTNIGSADSRMSSQQYQHSRVSFDAGISNTYPSTTLSTEENSQLKSALRLDTTGKRNASNENRLRNNITQRGVPRRNSGGDNEDIEEPVVMSPTSYPGMEWRPPGLETEF